MEIWRLNTKRKTEEWKEEGGEEGKGKKGKERER